MKSDFIELHQDEESIFINKNMIIAIYIAENDYGDIKSNNTTIECLGDYTYDVDENINDVLKCLE